MRRVTPAASPVLAAVLLSVTAGMAHAAPAVPVVEDLSAGTTDAAATPVSAAPQSTAGNPAAPAPAPAAGPADDLFGPPLTDDNAVVDEPDTPAVSMPPGDGGELVYQLQLLREEVLELRGLVEEQGYRLDRLARESQSRYMDLDRRVAALVTGEVGAGGENGAAADPAEPALPGEREAYTAAFELTRERQFAEAIAAFRQLLTDYPDGRFAGNAFYWLGELHLALDPPDLEASRQGFAQVVNLYPTHAKVPDALYKLGVVYHRLGDSDRAAEYLQQVLELHPGTTAARLADTYRAQL